MDSHSVGAISGLVLVSIAFAFCAGAFFWGLVTGCVPTEDLVEGSWWRNKMARKDEEPLKYWYYMFVFGGLTAMGTFIGVAVMLA